MPKLLDDREENNGLPEYTGVVVYGFNPVEE